MAFFPSLKQNFIAYRSSKVQIAFLKFTCCDNQALVGCILIPAVAVHLNHEIIKIGQSSYKMYSNNILNFHESTDILNVCTKKSGNFLNAPRISPSKVVHFVNNQEFMGGVSREFDYDLSLCDVLQKISFNDTCISKRFRFLMIKFFPKLRFKSS